MKDSIRLSDKHGLNPAVPICFFCNEQKNEVILAGKLPGDKEAPQNSVWDRNPCDKCANWMQQGIILISVRDGEEGDNPYRTGGWVVIRETALHEMLNVPELIANICKTRVAFIPDAAWDVLRLPRDSEELPTSTATA